MFNALGNHTQFPFTQVYYPIPELNTHRAFNYDKNFVCIFVVVPDKLALNFCKLEGSACGTLFSLIFVLAVWTFITPSGTRSSRTLHVSLRLQLERL